MSFDTPHYGIVQIFEMLATGQLQLSAFCVWEVGL